MAEQNQIPTRINITPRGKSWLAGKLVEGAAGHPTWQGAGKTLVAHAEGREPHIRAGCCPSEMEGYDKRDEECPVCQALLALEAE